MKKILLCSLIIPGCLISTAQNIGIGTTAPESKLHIKGSADASQLIIDANSTQSAASPLIRLRDASGNDLLHISSTNRTNSFFGVNAGSAGGGQFNTAIGSYALFVNQADYNTSIGAGSLSGNTTGNFNTATGSYSLNVNTTGLYNTATGSSCLFNNVSGQFNTASGTAAMRQNTTGSYNTAVGVAALYSNTGNAGYQNTAIGFQALYFTAASNDNTALGYNAGFSFDNGSSNIWLGSNADVNGAGYSNVIAIGQGTICTASNQVTIGNNSSTSYRAYANWSNISDGRYKKNVQENVPGLDFINQLRPVTYNLDATGLNAFLHKNNSKSTQRTGASKNNAIPISANDDAANAVYIQALKEKETIVYTGFVAQEVETTAKKIGFNFSGVDAPKNENDVYGLRYAEFVVPLVKAVQEQQQMIETLKNENQAQKNTNELLQKQIDDLKALLKK